MVAETLKAQVGDIAVHAENEMGEAACERLLCVGFSHGFQIVFQKDDRVPK